MALEVHDASPGIAIVTLSNPKRRNALDEETFRALADLWPRLESSPVRCVVVTGVGDAFCSGADLSAELTSLPDIDRLIDAALLKTHFFSKPVIAAINGTCVAGGFELALACDVRLASAHAKLGLPEARWGIFPSGGGAMHLAGNLGYAAASDLLLTGRLIEAEEAFRLGLVSRVVSSDQDVIGEALEVARDIARNSPAAVSAIKRYLWESRKPTNALIELEQTLTRLVRQSGDAKEGASAFLEKRIPKYRDLALDSREAKRKISPSA